MSLADILKKAALLAPDIGNNLAGGETPVPRQVIQTPDPVPPPVPQRVAAGDMTPLPAQLLQATEAPPTAQSDGGQNALGALGAGLVQAQRRNVPYEELSAPERINEDTKRLAELQQTRLPEDRSIKARLLRGIGEGLRAWSQSGGEGGLGGALGSVLGGGVINTVSPKLDSKMRTRNELQQIGERLKNNIALQDKQIEQDYKKAQTANIYEDNEDTREWRKSQLEERKTARTERTKAQALTKLFSGQYFDPANVAHRELALAAGLNPAEMSKIDLRNPVLKQIGDATFKYNRETGEFEESNLPKDGSKELVDFEVKIPKPNGTFETHKYKVSQEKAASFQTQMRAAGIQADLAEKRLAQQESQFSRKFQLSKEQFDQSKREFERVHSLRERQFNAIQDARAKNNEQEARRLELELDKYDTMLIKMLETAEKARRNNQLDDQQFEELNRYVQSKRP